MSTFEKYYYANKPPKGAIVKSYGAERLGNPVPRVQAGMDKGDSPC